MRTNRQHVLLLRGQVVFVNRQQGAMVLDCVLSAMPGLPGNAVTIVVRLPDEPVPAALAGAALSVELCRGHAPGIVMKQLRTWAGDGVPIVVEIPDREPRTELRMKAWDGELVLHPDANTLIA